MAATKVYLNAPYSQKDEAKALGAKWDSTQKKWYVLDDVDLNLFNQWQLTSAQISSTKKQLSTPDLRSTTNNSQIGIFTKAQPTDFIAYNGALPPWH